MPGIAAEYVVVVVGGGGGDGRSGKRAWSKVRSSHYFSLPLPFSIYLLVQVTWLLRIVASDIQGSYIPAAAASPAEDSSQGVTANGWETVFSDHRDGRIHQLCDCDAEKSQEMPRRMGRQGDTGQGWGGGWGGVGRLQGGVQARAFALVLFSAVSSRSGTGMNPCKKDKLSS